MTKTGFREIKTRNDIFEGVRDVLCASLNADESGVVPTARIVTDLGAESIDFLDITFRLEKTFNFGKIPRGELMPDFLLTNPDFVLDGVFTGKGITELERLMIYIDLSALKQNPHVTNLADLYTVELLVEYVRRRLGLVFG